MNADELQTTLDGLSRMLLGTWSECDSETLNDAWHLLNSHRLELEEAESKPVTATCPGALIPYHVDELPPRIDKIEEHLDAIDKAIGKRTVQGLNSDNRIDAVEKRLGEIGGHLACQTRSIGRHHRRLNEIDRKAMLTDEQIDVLTDDLRNRSRQRIPP